MEIIAGGVTAAKGFMAAGTAAGIKYRDRKDMAMVRSQVPCRAAGVFTRNVVKAAPVKWDQEIVYHKEGARAVVINSGIANACTGAEGYGYCQETAAAAAQALGIPEDSVLVASTGVIGQRINIECIEENIGKVKLSANGSEAANQAIMTTDTKTKTAAIEFVVGGKACHIGGICKGSGMIHPNMGTMLSFITTDCAITHEMLQDALSESVRRSYNRVTVDGDTSTNDMCVVLANGLAGNELIEWQNEDYEIFYRALHEVNVRWFLVAGWPGGCLRPWPWPGL